MTAGLGLQVGTLIAAVTVVLAILKLRPERESMVVAAAKDAVESLQTALGVVQQRMEEIRRERNEMIGELQVELVAVRAQHAAALVEIAQLRGEVNRLRLALAAHRDSPGA